MEVAGKEEVSISLVSPPIAGAQEERIRREGIRRKEDFFIIEEILKAAGGASKGSPFIKRCIRDL